MRREHFVRPPHAAGLQETGAANAATVPPLRPMCGAEVLRSLKGLGPMWWARVEGSRRCASLARKARALPARSGPGLPSTDGSGASSGAGRPSRALEVCAAVCGGASPPGQRAQAAQAQQQQAPACAAPSARGSAPRSNAAPLSRVLFLFFTACPSARRCNAPRKRRGDGGRAWTSVPLQSN